MADSAVDGIVLSAGGSTRMEKDKARLEIGSETFLERALTLLRGGGCRDIVVVTRDADVWVDAVAAAAGARVVLNTAPDSEQIDSLRAGVAALADGWAGVVVLPVDVPLITEATVEALIAAFRAAPAPLCLPFHNGVAGHPVLLGRELESAILDEPWDEGVRSLIMAHARGLREVRVDDPGILIDIDTPDDYWRYVQQK